ncbi:hypothetical protein JR316_0007917 [Psilocybe cubensis]|uniref:Uncharacterized protein n=2 Tax=Psilocybe cubensis TaxID=181762 RepID=A0ACB8GV61_PSICU|nr:hypothetical protein JR316_0007917 [Psilocybe cubensis]KAH9479327.1 hypothetical protein JR316_0007917 [Psilocybe cubensis]
MVPLIPALILAFVSFIASAFVILRIVIPILPPHPLSKRVSPAEFGLPTFRSLSPADKSHIWLASLDIVALAIFVWQVAVESTSGPTGGIALALNPGSAVRLWIAVTIRQTCLLFIAAVTLLHVRMAQSVSFGGRHWMLWAPTALFVITSTTVAGVLSGSGVHTLFYGLTAYSITIGVLTGVCFGYLIRTLFIIKKNLEAMNEPESWPPVRQMEEKPRPSFATEEIDAIRDGASWITSNASSRRASMSAWSFTTHQTATTTNHGQGRPQSAMHPSVPAKSSFWFGSTTANDIQVPPVPPLPSPYGPMSPVTPECDPFRRSLPPLPNQQKPRMGSQSSWLTSSQGSHTTISSWSYPTTIHDLEGTTPRPSTQDFRTAYSPGPETARTATPAMADAQVLGGYGYAPGGMEVEKGLASLAAPPGTTIQISMLPAYGWSVMICTPLFLPLPYFIILAQNSTPSMAVQILFILSVTLSSPLLALNLLFGAHLPIPVGLFDVRENLPTDPNRALVQGSLPTNKFSHEYKRSTSCSVTVVEGRRSGDVWLSKGDAVDGKGKIGRAVSMLTATPKLSVLPLEEPHDEYDMPPVPFKEDSGPVHVNGTPQSDNSVQFGRFRPESKASSHLSAGDESMAFASRIMVAQRHYSALAQTLHVAGAGNSVSGGARDSIGVNTLVSVASGAATNKRASQSSHLRSRSVTSTNAPDTPTSQERFNISPPPSFPLPPTPPNVRATRLAMLAHKKSFSSGQSFSFNAVDDINEIDALTAGVLPLLIPGLTLGDDIKIKNGDYAPPASYSKGKGRKAGKKLKEFGEDFSSPEVHSTPARTRLPRGRKESGHKRNHFSLPSLSLGKDHMHSLAAWSTDIRNALESKVGQYTAVPSNVDINRRNTVLGVETALSQLQVVEEEEEKFSKANLGRSMSTRSLGLRADVPHNVDSDTARSSVISISNMPPSAASTVTLFEEFEAGLLAEPQGESTPHQSTLTKKSAPRQQRTSLLEKRRSAIRYIKSDNDQNQPTVQSSEQVIEEIENAGPSTISSIAQWSSRAVQPLMPKVINQLARSPSDASSPKEGLRKLTLLQDRDSTSGPAKIKPLTLVGKRQKMRAAAQDENAAPGPAPAPRNKNHKALTLARSDTSKMRGILRKNEILPDVVVRPPSMSEHNAFSYSFRD